MNTEFLTSLRALSDADLIARIQGLVGREREVVAELIAHLAELDTRDAHFRMGYGSLYVYCRDALSLSEAEAYTRIEVARTVRRFPIVLEMLFDGALTLTAARLLAPHLTAENYRRVLESARGKRKAEVEAIAAALAPRPDPRPVVRKLADAAAPVSTPELPVSMSASHTSGTLPSFRSHVSGSAVSPDASRPANAEAIPPKPPSGRAEVEALAPSRYRLHVTISAELLEKLRLAKDLLRHAVPSGDDAEILDRALTAFLADLARKKFAATEAPRRSAGSPPATRHVPAEVKRAVWLRDLGRCAFVGDHVRRCNERAFLEFHHVKPYAVGGEATLTNVQLRCRLCRARHNRHYAGSRIMPTCQLRAGKDGVAGDRRAA